MTGHSLGAAVRRLRDALGGAAGGDAALLDRFAATRDPAAFAALVARYGPLVLGVCRRVVGDPHLAEDVFQAVFLVLARKAGSIRKRDAVGSWLYGVAYRLARKARSRLRFAHADTTPAQNPSSGDDPAATAAWNDLLAALDQELHRLPDRLRAPLLLCYYDGCTQDEAAARLGWSLGTLRRRLAQGRDRLRVRLTARWATLGAGLLATVLATRAATAAVPATLARTTAAAAEAFAAGGRLAGPVGPLAEEGLRMVGTSKVRALAALAVVVGGLAVGTGALFGVGRDEPTPPQDPPPAAKAAPPLPAGAVLRHGAAVFRHGDAVLNILVTPDGQTILTQGYGTVRLWDAATGRDRGILEPPDDGAAFWTASLTPDGRTVLTTRSNGTAQVWDLADRTLTRSFRLASPPFDVGGARAVHSPDGRAIAVVTQDGSIRVCDVTQGREMDQLRSHSDAVTAATFTPDGKRLVLASGRDRLLDWDVATGVEDSSRRREVSGVGNLRFSADGAWLAAARSEGGDKNQGPRASVLVFRWSSPDGPHELGGNSLADQLMAFTPDGNYLLAPDSLTAGRILTQWDLRTGRARRQYPEHREPIQALAFTPDGQTLVTADTVLRFWDWKTGQERRPSGPASPLHAYALTPDGKAVAEGDAAGTVRLWDAATGKELRRFDVPRPAANSVLWLNAVAVSPDGKLLAAQGGVMPPAAASWSDRRWYVWVWETATGRLRYRLDDPAPVGMNGPGVPNQSYAALTFSGSGKLVISTGAARPAVAWDVETGREESDDLLNQMSAARLVTDPYGRVAAGAIADNGAIIRVAIRGPLPNGGFGVSTNEFHRIPPDEGNPTPEAVAFTPKAERVAVGGAGRDGAGLVVVTDTQSGVRLGRVRNLPRPVARVALTADGKTVAAALAGESPPVLVFDVESGRELTRFAGLRGRAAWLAFAPDGRRVYAASSDTTVLAWDVGQ